jgi:transcriptional regulator GlxA family with amidase domain
MGGESSTYLRRMHYDPEINQTRPHEYLLSRRIERAQEMLIGTHMSLVDLA